MHAILHLGTEKTGTSSIQHFLKKNRNAIMQQGFYFMKSTGQADDRKLSAYCLLEGQFDDFHTKNSYDTNEKKLIFEKKLVEDIANEIKVIPENIHTVIFSSEHFHSRVRTHAQREKLKSLLSRFFNTVSLITYIRPQLEMAISHYSTYLKTKGTESLEQYLTQCEPENYYYNYWQYLSGWASSFEDSELIVRIFEREALIDKDIVVDFCHAVGLNYSILEKTNPINESVTPTGQELLKIVNDNFPSLTEQGLENTTRTAFSQIISRLFPGSGQRPSKEEAIQIQDKFKDINDKIKHQYFQNKDRLFDLNIEKYNPSNSIDTNLVIFFKRFLFEYKKINSSHFSGIPPFSIDTLRDVAIDLENNNLESALKIMYVAQTLRPDGDLINKKIREYELKKAEQTSNAQEKEEI